MWAVFPRISPSDSGSKLCMFLFKVWSFLPHLWSYGRWSRLGFFQQYLHGQNRNPMPTTYDLYILYTTGCWLASIMKATLMSNVAPPWINQQKLQVGKEKNPEPFLPTVVPTTGFCLYYGGKTAVPTVVAPSTEPGTIYRFTSQHVSKKSQLGHEKKKHLVYFPRNTGCLI